MAGLLLAALAPAMPAREVSHGSIFHASLAGDRVLWVETDWDGGWEIIRSARGRRRGVVRRLSHRDPDAPQLITDFAASRPVIAYERADEADDYPGVFTARREVVVLAGRRVRRLRLCRSRWIDGNPGFGVDVSGRRVAVGGRSCRRRRGITVLEFSPRGRVVRRRHLRVDGEFRLEGRFLAVENDAGVSVYDVRTGRRVTRPAGYHEFWDLAPDGVLTVTVGQFGGHRVGFQAPGQPRPRRAGPLLTGTTIAASSSAAAQFRLHPARSNDFKSRRVEVVTVDRHGRATVQARHRGLGSSDELVALDRSCVVYLRDTGPDYRLYAESLRGAQASPACPG